MRKARKALLMLLAVLMFVGTILGYNKINTYAADAEVTRIQWLHELTTVFNMTIEEEYYPDNYYSDINSSSEYYHDVMLATEFGLIDVEAGGELRPDDAATREFVAHTFNLCMGYYLDEGSEYTFSESASVTYPDDIQIAINRSWFELSEGNFLPEQAVTIAEMTKLIEEAAVVVASTQVQEDHNNAWEFADGVIVLPEGIEIEYSDDNILTIYDCPITLKVGDMFAVIEQNFPMVKKVTAVTVSDNKTVVTTESVDTQDAFKSIDIQGTILADLAEVQAVSDDIQLSYIVGGTQENDFEDGLVYASLDEVADQEISAVIATQELEIPENVRASFDLEKGLKAQVSCTITCASADYGCTWDSAYISISSIVKFDCNVSFDVLNAMGYKNSASLMKVRIAGVGYIETTVDISIGGNFTLSWAECISMGIQYKHGDGFRFIQNFYRESFTIQAQVQADVCVKAAAGVDVGFIKGEIYGKIGAVASISTMTYDGEIPENCTHVTAHMYLKIGCEIKLDILVYKGNWGEEITLYDGSNTPKKIVFHYEDGVPVAECTRDKEIESDDTGSSGSTSAKKYKYYTPITSRYGYSGASKGKDAEGNDYTLFEYSLDADNKATITKYNGNVSALSIPGTLDGYEVVGIGAGLFANNVQLRIVIIPDTVTFIGHDAFSGCKNLEIVNLPNSLVELEANAFKNCSMLTNINIPKTLVNSVDYGFSQGAFSGCDNLKTIKFEEGITLIAANLFNGCPGLETIKIPDTVTRINGAAFAGCENLKEVVMPNCITFIGNAAFSGCKNLEIVNLPSSLEELEANAFKNCSKLTNINIPKTLVNSVDYGFSQGAFSGCDNLKTIEFEEGITLIAANLFNGCPGLETIKIPDTVTRINGAAFAGCENLKEVVMPNCITFIGHDAFSGCKNLEIVNLPSSLVKLESNAFKNCSKLSNINIPKTLVESVEYGFSQGAFSGCNNLKKIEFEEGTTIIAANLFKGCPGLETIDIPETVTSIGYAAFADCINLKKIVIPDNVTSFGDYLFSGCTSLESVVLPNGRVNITEGLFKNCTSLENISIPDTVVYIRGYAFQNTGLTSITLPANVELIEYNAFQNCDSLISVSIPNNVTSIGGYAFQDCDALTSITISDSVTSIGSYCFENCDALSSVKLGNGLTKINSYTFNLCPELKSVTLPYRVAEIQSNAFTNCTALTEITIPRATETISTSAFSYPDKLTIYGISGTYAETYAGNIGATFVNKEVNANTVALDKTALTLNKGDSYTLLLTVTPSNFTDIVTWKSSDTNVATITDAGVVKAVNAGTATIRVTVGSKSASCKVTVNQPVTSISLNKTSLSLEDNATYQLTATPYPSNANNTSVKWSSSDTSVATVDQNGNVTALKKGSAVITVAAQDGSGVTKTCNVTVINNGYICTTPQQMESPHDYTMNSSDFWQYTLAGAEKLQVTFDAATNIEDGFDYLYVYDTSGNQVGKYTGTTLAGQTISVTGDTVKLKLVSDASGTEWGFKVTNITGGSSSNATVTSNGIYIAEIDRDKFVAGHVTTVSEQAALQYRWTAFNKTTQQNVVIQDWADTSEWVNWYPDSFGEYVVTAETRVKYNPTSVATASTEAFEFNPHIKGKCQMPYYGEGGGYLIGVESYENPNQSYYYEMLILDCTLLAEGKDAWVYTTGMYKVDEGNAGWCIWQPQYGYYWTLFRVYDADGVMIDQACYGFANAY